MLVGACAPSALPQEQRQERKPLHKVPAHLAGKGAHRLVLKFKDDLQVRVSTGRLQSSNQEALESVKRLVETYKLAFRPLLDLPEPTLELLERRAETMSRRRQPDLRGIVVAEMPNTPNEQLVMVAQAFEALSETEYVYLEPLGVQPPGDIAPPTPSYVIAQTYRGASIGLDVDGAWNKQAKGHNVRLSDCEYGWNTSHEDLKGMSVHPEPNQTPQDEVHLSGWDEHGTAVLGETSGLVNEYGISGIVPDAEVYTFPEWTIEGGFRRASAIAAAIAQSQAGDVVLLEMQAPAPNGAYVPAEYNPSIWDLVRNGVDQGVIVVAAAGNGAANLDAPEFASYLQRGNSGAIIVGAGTPDATHERLFFSTYGSRVDLQGWGEEVVTTGYGDFASIGTDINQRYTRFSGTSSASPLVASAAVAVQSYAKLALGRVLSPTEMKSLLVETGTPQGVPSTGHIGPLPNIRAAIEALGGIENQKPSLTVSAPVANATVAGVVEIAALADDADGTVTQVLFTLPDHNIQEDSTIPYAVFWDSTAVPDGMYSLVVRAIDDRGEGSEVTHSIQVLNHPCVDDTVVAAGLPLFIPDNVSQGVSSTVEFTGEGQVSGLQLSLSITHPYRGDLVVSLLSPTGERWVIHQREGGSGNDIVLVNISSSLFDGLTARGVWTLQVADVAQADVGQLVSWSLKVAPSCDPRR